MNRLFCCGLSALCCLGAGCTAVKQYRTGIEPVHYSRYAQAPSPRTNIIEVATNYTLGFVEFDDQGWLHGTTGTNSRLQIDHVTQRIRSELETNPLLLVVFVHGWKHNADGEDGNVKMFHSVLQELGELERARNLSEGKKSLRRVFGVYVGWRGLSATMEPFKELSFFGRKTTAERVGHGAVIELLAALEGLRTQDNRTNASRIASKERDSTKLLMVGHSFGADVLYCATAPILKERMVENFDTQGKPALPRPVGDLVVLINPAFEAARFETLQRLAVSKPFPDATNCTLAIFTSKADSATGFWFPFGRRFSTLFQRYQDRSSQRQANIRAVGHYRPYINFDLAALRKEKHNKASEAAVEQTSSTNVVNTLDTIRTMRKSLTSRTQRTNEVSFTFANANCRLTSKNYIRNDPVFNVAVDSELIPSHDNITRPRFRQFLIEFFGVFSQDDD